MSSNTNTFQPPIVPKDAEGYVKSFTLSSVDCPEAAEARAFFEQYGFVVIANVYTQEQCTATIDDIWDVIELLARQPVRNNEALWTPQIWSRTGYPDVGIIHRASLWTRQIILNRQTAALHTAYATILGTKDLLVNHDRYGMSRPAKEHPERKTVTNLHLDMNACNYVDEKDNSDQIETLKSLTYGSTVDWINENNHPGCAAVGELNVQGLVNLADNLEEDGGFWLVPGFHKYLVQWTKENRTLLKQYGRDDEFLLFYDYEIPELYAAACPITARAGSAILWDQRTMHGSRTNESLRPRYAQYYKMFPREHPAMTPKRAEHRRNAILRHLEQADIDPQTDLTPLGRQLFGLIDSSQ